MSPICGLPRRGPEENNGSAALPSRATKATPTDIPSKKTTYILKQNLSFIYIKQKKLGILFFIRVEVYDARPLGGYVDESTMVRSGTD
jgi:hypothetical protein